jgi:hypothetical protein
MKAEAGFASLLSIIYSLLMRPVLMEPVHFTSLHSARMGRARQLGAKADGFAYSGWDFLLQNRP